MIIYGGITSAGIYLNDVWSFNYLTMRWKELTETTDVRPPAAQGVCAATLAEDIYLIGGRMNKRYYNTLWSFNIGTQQFTEVSSGNALGAPLVSMNGECYIKDGSFYYFYGEKQDHEAFKEIYWYNFKTKLWSFRKMEPVPAGKLARATS
jgi:hypothetical protein